MRATKALVCLYKSLELLLLNNAISTKIACADISRLITWLTEAIIAKYIAHLSGAKAISLYKCVYFCFPYPILGIESG